MISLQVVHTKHREVMQLKSIWTLSAERPAFVALQGDLKTDVLIIGGGITGILCAYMLGTEGVDCSIIEADRILGGVTHNTTAKITVQHGLLYDKIASKYGMEHARLYFEAQNRALEQYKTMCRDIQCDFEEKDAYVYACDSCEKIEKEVQTLQKIGCDADFIEHVSLPVKVKGAARIRKQGQFHPLKFLYTIAKDIQIFENTRATEYAPGTIKTENGTIKAKTVIVATHFPFINNHGGYFLKMYQHRSYVVALKNAPSVDGMYVDAAEKGLSFRNHNGLLLLGGGSHRTGKKGGAWQELAEFAKKQYPKAEEVCRWATQDCMTLDGMPYIGQYSKNTTGLFVATGFNKWGMTSAMTAAMLLRDMIMGRGNACAKVFSPERSMMHPQLAVNMAESLMGLLRPTAPRCPHMGCALHYNMQEHSWDCACHGSRFTVEGKVINGPANGNKE